MKYLSYLCLLFLLFVAPIAESQTAAVVALSPDGTTLTAPGTGSSLMTSAGTWTFGTATTTNGGNAILLNGSPAAGGYGTLLEVAASGNIFTQAKNGSWYEYILGAWVLQSQAPVVGSAPSPSSNTILNGSAAPGSTVGNVGDFYIATSNWSIYGPKASGGWPAGVSLVGPAGTGTSGGGCGWLTSPLASTDTTHPVAATDNCKTLTWSGVGNESPVFPATSSVAAGFSICFQDYSVSGRIAWTSAWPFKGGVSSIGHDEWACFMPDGAGNWSVSAGGLPNEPNASLLP